MRSFLYTFVLFVASLAFGAEPKIPVVVIKDAIHIGTFEQLTRLMRFAAESHAPAVLIELDTPGGYLESTRDIVQLFLASDIPIIVWVTPEGARAASAGSMITMAAHYAAMSPSTSIGAATPVSAGGSDIAKDMKAKVENDTLSFVQGIAEKRKRNSEWAKESVSKAASLSASDALKKNVIDGIHSTREEVWKGAQKKFTALPTEVEFVEMPSNTRENVLGFISNPNVAYGMMALGALGIYMEISHPGVIVPGAIGALSLALGAITTKIIPIRPGAIALLILGLILIAIEILTPLPTYGVAGAGGAISLLLSGIFLMDASQTNLHLSAGLWFPVFIVSMAFMFFLGGAAVRALKSKPYAQGIDALIGKTARVVSVTQPGEAKIQVHGELWTAQWMPSNKDDEFFVGQEVKVIEHKAFIAYVRPDHKKGV